MKRFLFLFGLSLLTLAGCDKDNANKEETVYTALSFAKESNEAYSIVYKDKEPLYRYEISGRLIKAEKLVVSSNDVYFFAAVGGISHPLESHYAVWKNEHLLYSYPSDGDLIDCKIINGQIYALIKGEMLSLWKNDQIINEVKRDSRTSRFYGNDIFSYDDYLQWANPDYIRKNGEILYCFPIEKGSNYHRHLYVHNGDCYLYGKGKNPNYVTIWKNQDILYELKEDPEQFRFQDICFINNELYLLGGPTPKQQGIWHNGEWTLYPNIFKAWCWNGNDIYTLRQIDSKNVVYKNNEKRFELPACSDSQGNYYAIAINQ